MAIRSLSRTVPLSWSYAYLGYNVGETNYVIVLLIDLLLLNVINSQSKWPIG